MTSLGEDHGIIGRWELGLGLVDRGNSRVGERHVQKTSFPARKIIWVPMTRVSVNLRC